MKQGNEPLVGWLATQLHPSVDFRVHEIELEGKEIVYFEVPAAAHTPARFKEHEYIRVGATTRKLKDYTEKERKLWSLFGNSSFETEDAALFPSVSEALASLDFESYLILTESQSLRMDGLADLLAKEGFIRILPDESCAVTNMGALLLAKSLETFARISRKAPRVVFYKGENRAEALHEYEGKKGYAVGFSGLTRFLQERLPKSELIKEALRSEVSMFPAVAIRELVANALIHQELSQPGAGPMIEVFPGRIEITNPGISLVELQRIIDAPPRSRNEKVATFMRRIGICEERGSGIDRVIAACETYQLPAPDFMLVEGFTRVTLFAPMPLKDMSKADRVRASYQHSVLQWVSHSQMTNASLRKRLGIKESNSAHASRIIKEALAAGAIKEFDPTNKSNKHNKYVPCWA